MTPDEHAATVRFKDAVRAVRPRYRELNSPLWDVLDEAVALAERATELERDGTAIYGQWEKLRGELEAVEARATELERERDDWKATADQRYETQTRYKLKAQEERERAERAETALRKITTDHPMIDACPYCAPVVRAALGETAP